jgi:hypothetical protein
LASPEQIPAWSLNSTDGDREMKPVHLQLLKRLQWAQIFVLVLSGGKVVRYHYNNIMYRLDLSGPRLGR